MVPVLCTMMVMLALCPEAGNGSKVLAQIRTVPLSLASMLLSVAMDTSSSDVLDNSVNLTSPIFLGVFPPFLEKEFVTSFTFHRRFVAFTVHVMLILALTQVSKNSVAG